MKPCAFINHPLSDHIKGCKEILDSFLRKNKGYTVIAAKRLKIASRGKLSLKPEEVEELINLSVILHDIGKAHNYFQENFDENCGCRDKDAGFPYHELLSAGMCYKHIQTWTAENAHQKKLLLTLSIINHHHAFKDTLKKVFYIDQSSSALSLLLKIVKKGLYVGNLQETLKAYGINIEDLSLTANDVENFITWMRKSQERPNEWQKLYVLIMTPLIIADNLDAGKSRPTHHYPPSRTSFLNELKEAI